ncbi:MAG: glycosyltransferase family 2 protein, partial [Caulobacteraceae bacterium]
MTFMRVTVVVPAYNVARYIGDALASLQAQTCTDWRCIVIDDGSTDDVVTRVEAVADARIQLVRQANAGVS